MTNKLAIFALGTLLSFCNAANAGVILYVSFGDNALLSTQNESDLVQNYNLTGQSNLTANIYLRLTGGTTIYGYRFSVRFNSELVTFVDRNQIRYNSDPDIPSGFFDADTNVDNEFETDHFLLPDPDPVQQSQMGVPIDHGKDLYRFNGIRDDNLSAPGFYKLAEISFTINQPTLALPDGPLVIAGAFDPPTGKDPPYSPDDVSVKDKILAVENIDDYYSIGITSQGGFVGSGPVPAPVPEPFSGIVFGALGLMTLLKRKQWSAQKSC